jgi:hypothetical protein
MLKLEVGKTYAHATGDMRFAITQQWSTHLFEGHAVGPNGNKLNGVTYMFNNAGEAIGWRGNKHNASLNWRLKDDNPDYEYRLIYNGAVDTSWSRLTKLSPRYSFDTSKYLIRERNKHETTRLIEGTELKALQEKAPAR